LKIVIKNKRWILVILLFIFLLSHQILSFEAHHSPPEGAQLENNRPIITFTLRGNVSDLKTVKLFVNGMDVTHSAVITRAFLTYRPLESLPAGKNNVKVTFTAKNGKEVSKEWSFFVRDTKPIKSVSHNAKSELMEKETLHVILTGAAGSKATFDIGGFKTNIQMKEIKPGVYEGRYEVKRHDNIFNAPVIGRLITRDGASFREKAKKPVSIDARFFRLKILEPLNNSYVSQNFKVRGRTRANTIVKVATGLAFNFGDDSMSAPAKLGGGPTIEVNETGIFEETLGFPVAMKGMKMAISAHAIDRKGNQSMPDTITVYLKIKKKKGDSEGKDGKK